MNVNPRMGYATAPEGVGKASDVAAKGRSFVQRRLGASSMAIPDLRTLHMGTAAFTADEWWSTTIFLCWSKRWVVALPLAVLIPLALWARSHAGGSRLCLSPRWWSRGRSQVGSYRRSSEEAMRIARRGLRVLTCNTFGSNLKEPALEQLIAQTLPDIVALQECSSPQAESI